METLNDFDHVTLPGNPSLIEKHRSSGEGSSEVRIVRHDHQRTSMLPAQAIQQGHDVVIASRKLAKQDRRVADDFCSGLNIVKNARGAADLRAVSDLQMSCEAGLTGSASFTVTIVDTTPPILTNVPAPIKVEETNPAGTPVTVPLPAATDLVDTKPAVTSDAPALFPRGTTTVTFTATDFSGNKTKATITVTVMDTIAPTTSATPSPGPDAHGWNKTDVTVTLQATDNPGGSGVKQIAISLSGSQTGTNTVAGSSAVVKITAEGTTTLTYFATDNAGNVERAKTLTVKIDKTRPIISGMPAPGCKVSTNNNQNGNNEGGNLIKIATITATDVLSGLVAGSLKVTGTSNQPSNDPQNPQVVITPNGSGGFVVKVLADSSGDNSRVYTLTATASDLAGNTATVTGACTVPNGHE